MSELLRVLVVEDNPADADLIREILPERGPVSFRIESVRRLSEALARLRSGGLDLVLLDLGLPDGQGLETFRSLRNAAPHIPTIILTGNDNQEMAVSAVREGAQDYLIKGQVTGNLLVQAARYAVERKRAEQMERLAREVLELLNAAKDPPNTVGDILRLVKASTGFEAVGIRLREGDDYPYYEANGFHDDFLRDERYLCERDAAGQLVLDEHGRPVLGCMCGNIIRGRTDPALPFFTAGGSFWTNSTTDLLASTTEKDRQARTRNRCNTEGYESVALIPLRSGDETIGLLQLSDHRRGMFTPEIIRFFEGLGASIGIALARKRAEEALRESERKFRQTQKMEVVGQLAGGIAHDFNNILQVIVGHSEILLEGLEEQSPHRQDAQDIHTAAERAVVLTRQLLVFSGRQVIAPVIINLNAVVENLERMLQRMIGENIRIVTNLALDLKKIRADAGQIEQILMNLAINARDAMPDGGRITIGTDNVTLEDKDLAMFDKGRSGQFVCITVTDTGIGMSKEVQQRIFEPFFTTKGPDKGTGLGLAAVYGIAGQHGGWVNVYSEPGQGSTFKVYLPGCPDDEARAEASLESGQLQHPAHGLGERILVVEDEVSIRTLVAHILHDWGYRVSIAGTVQEALSLFNRENGQFDLLISDVILPDKSGLDLAEAIRAQKPGQLVLLCSGYADERSCRETISEKGFHFLQKPFPLATLLSTVQTILSAPSAGHY